MQYDEIIECPKSGGDLCYKIEVSADITQYMSLSCGFWSNTLLKVDSDFYNEQMELLPELYKALAWLDTKTDLSKVSLVPIIDNWIVFNILRKSG